MKKTYLKSTFFALMCTAFVGVSTPVLADSSPEDLARFVKMCDSNADGMVSKTEVMKRVESALKAMNAPASGMIDSKRFMDFLLELKKTDGAVAAAPAGKMMSKADLMKKVESAFTMADSAKKSMLDAAQLKLFIAELNRGG